MKKKTKLCLNCLKAYTTEEAKARGHRCSCGGKIEREPLGIQDRGAEAAEAVSERLKKIRELV